MANEEHLRILSKGAQAWNGWRANNRGIRPDLSYADLRDANLSYADLSDANLHQVILASTALARVDLSEVLGIETARHWWPSSIGTDTLELTAQGLAKHPSRQGAVETVLRGAGVPEVLMHAFRAMSQKPFEFYSCFISYSHENGGFADRLYAQLQASGIRCWQDKHDARVGDPIQDALDRGFKITQKVLLCCSHQSLTSTWVSREINKAFAKEERLTKAEGKPRYVLIPLNLDGFLFERNEDGEHLWTHGWGDEIRNRIAADFKGWEGDNAKFEAGFGRVVDALRAEGG